MVTYSELIYAALRNSPNHTMQLQDVYNWFEKNTEKGSKTNIRCELSMNEAFQNVCQGTWQLTEKALRDGVKSTSCSRYRRYLKLGTQIPIEPTVDCYAYPSPLVNECGPYFNLLQPHPADRAREEENLQDQEEEAETATGGACDGLEEEADGLAVCDRQEHLDVWQYEEGRDEDEKVYQKEFGLSYHDQVCVSPLRHLVGSHPTARSSKPATEGQRTRNLLCTDLTGAYQGVGNTEEAIPV